MVIRNVGTQGEAATGRADIRTGLGFFDHMLTLLGGRFAHVEVSVR
jgi:imidazoleglycerol phosphate dehydratase HisB